MSVSQQSGKDLKMFYDININRRIICLWCAALPRQNNAAREGDNKMNVNAVNGTNMQRSPMGAASADDAMSKSLKEQITRAQKQLQELAQNGELPLEEKMKKRQEIQQQINDLNNQLRQHQIELRKEKQQEKAEELKAKQGGEQTRSEIDEQTTSSILSADSSLKQAKIQDNAATAAQNRANVIKSELKTAKGEKVIEAKQKEIAELEQTAQSAKNAQAQSLGDANKAMENVKAPKREETQDKDAAQEEENVQNEEKPVPKMYTSEGKPVEEESEPVISEKV